MSKKPKLAKIVHKAVPIAKKKYWQKRSIEKLSQAVRAGDGYLTEAKEFMYHADMMDKKMIIAFNNVKGSFNKLANEIGKPL